MNLEVKGDHYHVNYNAEKQTVLFKGSLRLNGSDSYEEISNLLKEVAASGTELVILDLQELEFLNSSGINMFYKFVMGMKNQPDIQVNVLGNAQTPWQKKSLSNMQRFLKTIQIDYV